MRVLFVRHAESTNNVLQRSIMSRIDRGELDMKQAMLLWRQHRTYDAPLTEKGRKQAAAFGSAYETAFADGECVIVASGMQRACETAKALHDRINRLGGKCEGYIRPDTHEVGGLYGSNMQTGEDHAVAGRTAAELHEAYGFNTTRYLPATGSWYHHPRGAKENDQEAIARAKRVAQWLFSADASSLAGSRTLVFVAHEHFLSLLLAALYNLKHPQDAKARLRAFRHHNTATSLMEIDASRQHVSLVWGNRHDHLGEPTAKL